MKEEENEEEVNVNIEILSRILSDILNDSRKQKAEDSVYCYSCKGHASSHGGVKPAIALQFVSNISKF
ncbi:hypothetical protein CI238_13443 [Colletotrichum incanum]|uniref:Uncharacterized protein n=1 Tax=Colletotrichum incanum TaxID=1573173 RepID=A0A166WYQ8_COLIC|nr:hypothetical protein CI238_13443 [Colletotrichum incanum]